MGQNLILQQLGGSVGNKGNYLQTAGAGYAEDSGIPVGGTSINAGISQTFAEATANIPVVEDFIFGSAAVAGPGQTAIRNAADLATYFNPLEDFAGTNVTGTTMGSDVPFTQTDNFVFDTNDLALTATLEGGTTAALVASGTGTGTGFTTGTSTLISAFSSIANTTGMFVGGIMGNAFFGGYYISAIADSTHVTLQPLMGAPTTVSGNFQASIFYPYTYATSSGASSGGVIPFTSGTIPNVTVGQSVYWLPGGASGTPTASNFYVVTAVTATSVTVAVSAAAVSGAGTPLPNLASGTGYIFGPQIQVAQIWDKNSYQAPASPANIFAIEFTVVLPDTKGVNQGFNPTTLPAGAPVGAWPALWMYSRNTNPSGITATNMGSEVDILELNLNVNQGFKNWTGNLHGAVEGAGFPFFYASNAGTWTPTFPTGNNMYSPLGTTVPFQYCAMATDPSQPPGTVQKYQFIATGGIATHYFNGVPLRSVNWSWGDQFPMHWSVGMAIGAWNQLGALFAPTSNGMFPCALKLQRVTVSRI